MTCMRSAKSPTLLHVQEQRLTRSNEDVQYYCDKLQPTYRQLGLNVTLEDCRYGAALVSSESGAACVATIALIELTLALCL